MDLTQERLKELLDYDPLTGVFCWAKKPGKSIAIGSRAGCVGANGYIYIRVDGVLYLAHRLAFLWMTGAWPSEHVDHINGKQDDNRWSNLRECNRSQNMCNAKKRKGCAVKFKGVYLHKASGLYHARINKNGRTHSLGYFSSPELAADARDAAARRLHGEFARTNEAA